MSGKFIIFHESDSVQRIFPDELSCFLCKGRRVRPVKFYSEETAKGGYPNE